MTLAYFAVLAGAALGSPVAGFELTVDQPARSLPHAETTLRWLSAAFAAAEPSRWQRRVAPLGIDPFGPDTWREAGVSGSDPWTIRGQFDRSEAWANAKLTSPDRFRAALSRVPPARITRAPDANGAVFGRKGRPEIVLAVRGDRVAAAPLSTVLPISGERWPAYVQERIAVLDGWLERAAQSRGSSSLRTSAPRSDLRWVLIAPHPSIHRADGTIDLPRTEGPLRVRGHAELSPSAQERLRTHVRNTPAPRWLGPLGEAVAEVAVRLEPQVLLSRIGAPSALADRLDGSVHAQLLPDGGLIVALGLNPAPRTPTEPGWNTALGPRYAKATVRAEKGHIRVGIGTPPAPASAAPSRAAAPIFVQLRPAALLSALSRRARSSVGPRPTTAQLAVVRLLYGRWLDQTEHSVISVTPGKTSVTASLEVTLSDR